MNIDTSVSERAGQPSGKLDLWNRFFIWIVLFLAVTAPYFGGLRVAYPLIFITLFITLATLIRKRNPWSEGDISGTFFLVAFALLAVAFLVTAREPIDAIYIFNFLMFALYAPVALSVGRFAQIKNTATVAVYALVGSVLSAFVAVFQVIGLGYRRATGFGSDPIWSAEAAVLLGFIALLGFSASKSRYRFVFFLGPILGTFVCILSGSRGPLLAVLPLMAVFVLFATRHRLRNIAIGLLALAVCAGVLWTAWPETASRFVLMANDLPDFLRGGVVDDKSVSQRSAMYSAGYQAFLHSPWIGYGWHSKVDATVPYLPEKFADFPQIHHHLHSDGLDFAVSGGILGILAYLLVLAAPIAGAVRSPRDSQFRVRLTAAVMLTVGYATFGLTYLLFGYEFHTTLYVVLTAIVVRYCRDEPLGETGEVREKPPVMPLS
jgi:O-antigen ligase